MELLYFIGGKMSKKFASLKRLKMSNTERLEQLKANLGIESVVLENSKILSISTFVKRVPPPLLSRNNMANYTQVKVNNVLLSEVEIEKLKIGKMNVENNDTIEVIDGILAGTIFTIKLGLPLNTMIKDPVLLTHVKELLGKESITSDVSKYELDTITWIGKDPSQITENSYLGYFNAKTIGNFEIFKKDLEWFPNLKYVNLSGSIFADSVSLSDFPGIDTFNYSFADCVVLQSIVIDKNVKSFEGALRNCQNLRTVTINDVEVLGADKSFHNCKGIRNLTVANPNMVDQRTLNTFSEAIVSEVTFNGEPTDNVITSNILLDAIASSITIDLTGKKRPDLYNLISTPNNLAERLILNNTNILELDLTKPTHNFLNLRQILAENTEDLRKIKLAGNNIQVLNLNNSSGIYLQIAEHETPAIFIDNAAYYNRIEINSVELDPLQVLELKKGNWVFNNNDIAKMLDGPLANYLLEVSDGIIPTRISKMFPDEILADYIRFKTNKETINDKVRQGEIDSIVYFGSEGIVTDITTPSWFNGKVVDSFEGTEQLRNLKNFYIKGISGAFNSITLLTSKMTSLFGAFYGTTALNNINVVGNLDLVEDISHIFEANTGITDIDFLKNNLQNIKRMKNAFKDCTTLVSANISSATNVIDFTSTFEGCTAISSVNLPVSLSNTTSIKLMFKGNVRLSSITLPSVLESLNDMSSAFEGCTSLSTLSGFLNLNALGNMNRAFYGCESLTSIILPRQFPSLTTAVDTFNSAIELRSLDLGNLPLIVDISGIVMNTPKLTTIKLDPLLTNCLSTLESTGLDSPGKNIVYSANPDVIYYTQIKYHDENSYPEYQNATLNYSALTNLRPLIRKIFPCPTVAQYIALQLNKTIHSSVLIDELHGIEWFGFNGLNPDVTDSWFSGKTILSFEGLQHLINIKGICISQATSTPSTINLTNINKLQTLKNAFSSCRDLVSVQFPNDLELVTSAENVFKNCIKLLNVTLPNMPNNLSFKSSFDNCPKLVSAVVKNSDKVTDATSMFDYSESLNNLTIPDFPSLTKGSNFLRMTNVEYVTFTNLDNLDNFSYAFQGCGNLKKVILPMLPNIEYLRGTFTGCDILNEIELPPLMPRLLNTLESTDLDKVGRTIIYLADSTVETKAQIKFHNGSTPEYQNAILDYSRLPDLKLAISEYFPCPTIAEYIGIKLRKTVNDPVSKTELATVSDLGDNDGGWGTTWFKGKTIHSFEGIQHLTGIKSINLEESSFVGGGTEVVLDLRFATKLEELYNAFRRCQYLREVIFYHDLPSLNNTNRVFEYCYYLRKVTLPTNVPNFRSAYYMFGSCSRLEEVHFLGNWKSRLSFDYAFSGCRALKTVTLPTNFSENNGMRGIFEGCVELIKVNNLAEEYPNLELMDNAFYNTAKLTIEGTNGIMPKKFPKATWINRCFSYSALPSGNLEFNFPKATVASQLFDFCKNISEVTLNFGNQVTSLIDMARSSTVERVTVNFSGEKLTNIDGSRLVAYCGSLTSLTINGEAAMHSLRDAFYQCDKLQSLDLTNISAINDISSTFIGCSSLNLVKIKPRLNITTTIDASGIDQSYRTIQYAADPEVTVKGQIFYHDPINGQPYFKNATLDYSNLNLYPDGSFFAFFNNLELANHVSAMFGLTARDIMESGMTDIVTEIGGPLAMPSKITGNITDWSFVEKLHNLQFINLSGNVNITHVDLSRANNMLEMRNSFRACSFLTELKLPISCQNISNFTYLISNTSQNISVYLPAIMPSASTAIEMTGLDREGVTLIYYPDDSVTTINQITYFPTVAKANCSALINCTDAPNNLNFGEFIETEITADDSDLLNYFYKEQNCFRNKVCQDGQILRGVIKLTTENNYSIEVTASTDSEANYDFLSIFASNLSYSADIWQADSSGIQILKKSGSANETTTTVNNISSSKNFLYIAYRKDGSGSRGNDCGYIFNIKIKRMPVVLNESEAAELDYITDAPKAIPSSLKSDQTMTALSINGKAMHSTVVEQIKAGEFCMPKYGEYNFKPLDGKYKDINFKCNYVADMFADDIEEAEIVK